MERHISWNGQNDDFVNANCKHEKIEHYEGGFSEVMGELGEFDYCVDCGMPTDNFLESHPKCSW